jgi:hypothetical protein
VVEFRATAKWEAGGFRIEFPTLEGKRYQVEASQTLAPGSWQPLGEVITGTGAPYPFLDTPSPDIPYQFYRLTQLP